MQTRTIVVIMSMAALLLFTLLSTSTPSKAGPVGVLFVFVLLYILLVGCIIGILRFGSVIIARLAMTVRTRRPIQKLSVTHSYYYASVLALVPVMLLAMKSVGRVDWKQLLLVALFATIACIYVKKRIG